MLLLATGLIAILARVPILRGVAGSGVRMARWVRLAQGGREGPGALPPLALPPRRMLSPDELLLKPRPERLRDQRQVTQ